MARASYLGRGQDRSPGRPDRLQRCNSAVRPKVNGRTVNKRLSEQQARLYEQWIANDRAVRALLADMRAIALEAQALILTEEASKPARQGPSAASPEIRRPASRRSG